MVGLDTLIEHGGDGLYQPLDLKIARCRMSVAVRADFDYAAAVRLATAAATAGTSGPEGVAAAFASLDRVTAEVLDDRATRAEDGLTSGRPLLLGLTVAAAGLCFIWAVQSVVLVAIGEPLALPFRFTTRKPVMKWTSRVLIHTEWLII